MIQVKFSYYFLNDFIFRMLIFFFSRVNRIYYFKLKENLNRPLSGPAWIKNHYPFPNTPLNTVSFISVRIRKRNKKSCSRAALNIEQVDDLIVIKYLSILTQKKKSFAFGSCIWFSIS